MSPSGDGVAENLEKATRPYRLRQRGVSMEETRTRVLSAARELILSDDALTQFSMEAVSKLAGVTRVTVYQRFGSKRGLLEALFDEMGERGALMEKIPAALSRPRPQDAIQAYILVFCEFWEVGRAMNRRLRAFAALDKEFAEAIEARYERRHRSWNVLMARLGNYTDEPVSEETMSTLLALSGFEFYDVLAGESRAPEEVASTIYRLVMAELKVRVQ